MTQYDLDLPYPSCEGLESSGLSSCTYLAERYTLSKIESGSSGQPRGHQTEARRKWTRAVAMTEPIIIVGAGIAGLALGQALRKHDIAFRIYERDQDSHSRSQGYRVRISDDGIEALEASLQPNHFDRLCHTCAGVPEASNVPSALFDAVSPGEAKPVFPPGQRGPPTTETRLLSADRGALRTVLRQGIEDCISYDKDFDRYTEDGNGVTVSFKDETSVRGSALIAADGAFSRVRHHKLPDYRLADSEARLIYGKTALSEQFRSIFPAQALDGLVLVRSPKQTVLMETMRFDRSVPEAPSDYVYWVLFGRKDQHMPDEKLFRLTSEETLQLALQCTSDWHENYQSLVDPKYALGGAYRVVTCRPADIPTSAQRSRVVLIGDAQHAMPPTAALGANTSLRDVGVLMKHLHADQDTTRYPEAFRSYEEEMKGYAAVALQKTLVGGRAVFGMKPFDELPSMP